VRLHTAKRPARVHGLFLVEIVRDGQPVGDGELVHLLITDLSNHAMPCIRYGIGDVGQIRHIPCK